MVGVHVGVGPLVADRRRDVLSRKGKEHAHDDKDRLGPGAYGEEGNQVQGAEKQLAYCVKGDDSLFPVNGKGGDRQGQELDHKGQGNKRGDDADQGVPDPDGRQQLCQKGVRDQEGGKIFKGTLGDVGFSCACVQRGIKNQRGLFHGVFPFLFFRKLQVQVGHLRKNP